MLGQMTYKEAIAKASHLIAVGMTGVWLDEKSDSLPWGLVDAIETGGGYRFNGPTGVRLIVNEAGLKLHWYVEFEGRDANGRGVSLFDRDNLRSVMLKLSPKARQMMADFFEEKVLPDMEKRTAEIRASLNLQTDSEDCVRGLIVFGRQKAAA